MAGPRRRSRQRSVSASLSPKGDARPRRRRSSRSSSRSGSRGTRGFAAAAAAGCSYGRGGGRERATRRRRRRSSSSGSCEQRRKGRSPPTAAAAAEAGYNGCAGEREEGCFSSVAAAKGAEKGGKRYGSPLRGRDVAEEMKERRQKRPLQAEQTEEGRRGRGRSAGDGSSRYGRKEGVYCRREERDKRGGGGGGGGYSSGRFDGSSCRGRYDACRGSSSSRREEDSSCRGYENRSCKYANSTGRSDTRYGDGSRTEEGGRRRFPGAGDSSVYGEKGSSRSSRYLRSDSKRGMPTGSTYGYGESSNRERCGECSSAKYGSSIRYGSSSSSGKYSGACSARDGRGRRNTQYDSGRGRRASPAVSHGEGRHEQHEEEDRRSRRRSRRYSHSSRSGERGGGGSPARRSGRGDDAAQSAAGRRGGGWKEEAAARKETAAERRTAAAAAAGDAKRGRSFLGNEEGIPKKQRLRAPAATIGSRASFLRSSNAPAAPVVRAGGSSRLCETEAYKDEAGRSGGAAGSRVTEQQTETRKQDDGPLPRGEKRITAGGGNHVGVANSMSGEKGEGRFQQQPKERLQQQLPSGRRQREDADVAEGQQLQNSVDDSSLYNNSSRSAAASAGGEQEQQQQLKRGRSSSAEDEEAKQKEDVERSNVETRTYAKEQGGGRKRKEQAQEDQQREDQQQQEEHYMEGRSVEKREEAAREAEKACDGGRVLQEQQQVESTSSKTEAAADGRQQQERVGSHTQQRREKEDGLPEQDGENAAATRPEREEGTTAAAARAAGAEEAPAGQETADPTAAEREKGVAGRRTEETEEEIAARTPGGGGIRDEVLVAGATTREGQATTEEENYEAAKHGAEKGEIAVAPGRGTEEQPGGACETDRTAAKEGERSAAGDVFHAAARRRVDAGEKSEREAESSRPPAVSPRALLGAPRSGAEGGDIASVAADGKSPVANETASATERPQEHEEAAGAAVAAEASAGASASPSSPAAAQVEAVEATAAEGAAPPEGEAEAPAAAQEERGDKSQEDAADIHPEGLRDAEAHAPAEGEEINSTAGTPASRDRVVALERERSSLVKRSSHVSAALGAEEEEKQQHQIDTEDDEKRYANNSSGTLQHSCQTSWRVVTADSSSMQNRNRSGSGSGTSGISGEEGYPAAAEETSRKRARGDEERREKGGEERRRIWYRPLPVYAAGSPEPQKETASVRHADRSYPVPSSSYSNSWFLLRRNYSPSRLYSPSRDLSPGPSAAPYSAAYNRGDRHRTVHVPSAAHAPAAFLPRHAAAATSDPRAGARPRAAGAVPLPPYGPGAPSGGMRGRRGETAFVQLQERSAPAVSLRGRCGGQNSVVAPPLPTATPLAPACLTQQQQQQQGQQHQYGRKNNRNFIPAPVILSSTLPRAAGRPPLGDVAYPKFGAAKEPRRKENSKWTHDLFEQVAREPEKVRRRFNLYSEKLEIAE